MIILHLPFFVAGVLLFFAHGFASILSLSSLGDISWPYKSLDPNSLDLIVGFGVAHLHASFGLEKTMVSLSILVSVPPTDTKI
jgi:hypothetical protein